MRDLRSIHGSEVRTGQARALGRPGLTRGDGASLHAQRRGTISRPRTHRDLVAHQLAPSSRPRGADQPRLALTTKTSRPSTQTGSQIDSQAWREHGLWHGLGSKLPDVAAISREIPIQQIGNRPGHGQLWLDMVIIKLSMTTRWFDCPILTPGRRRDGASESRGHWVLLVKPVTCLIGSTISLRASPSTVFAALPPHTSGSRFSFLPLLDGPHWQHRWAVASLYADGIVVRVW